MLSSDQVIVTLLWVNTSLFFSALNDASNGLGGAILCAAKLLTENCILNMNVLLWGVSYQLIFLIERLTLRVDNEEGIPPILDLLEGEMNIRYHSFLRWKGDRLLACDCGIGSFQCFKWNLMQLRQMSFDVGNWYSTKVYFDTFNICENVVHRISGLPILKSSFKETKKIPFGWCS